MKVISGTERGDRLSGEAVTLTDGRDPIAPDFLGIDERKVWGDTLALIRPMGLLSSVDVSLMTAYCISVVLVKLADQKIAAEGICSLSAAGLPCAHPAVTIRRQAMLDMVSHSVQMGLTPTARLRLNADTAPKKNVNPFDAIKNGE